MFAHYPVTMIVWARGEIDADAFRAATRYGMCAMLLGVARGRARSRLAAELRALQSTMASGRRSKSGVRKGGRS
jgi:plasmid replication initiation protein